MKRAVCEYNLSQPTSAACLGESLMAQAED